MFVDIAISLLVRNKQQSGVVVGFGQWWILVVGNIACG